MPSVTLPTAEDKAIIKRAQPSSKHVAHPNPANWRFTGVWGGLVLTKDLANGAYFMRLVDMDGKGLVWEQELYEHFEYRAALPYFHVFAGDQHVFGLDFADVGEAEVFLRKVHRAARKVTEHGERTAGNGAATAKATISVGGFDIMNKRDPRRQRLVVSLAQYGITEKQLEDEATAQFVVRFIEQHATTTSSAPPPPAPPPPPPPPPQSPKTSVERQEEESAGAPAQSSLPPQTDGRAALLAAIRGASVSNLRKAQTRTPAPLGVAKKTDEGASPSSPAPGGGEGNLANALAAALSRRNKAIAGSDSEEEDGDDDWD
ncbi:hypothetical protein EV182_002729 [Spiromyces aspiralis]|uniref:Uncharacterized protein n=1 Tax=Spiromyces aspiralis TaxID=68401 RepID=A0ACC1HXI6_9FUNG|nr:hypothetical protein EV182_002729 [Spiromyces aspiralis]